MVKTRWRNC